MRDISLKSNVFPYVDLFGVLISERNVPRHLLTVTGNYYSFSVRENTCYLGSLCTAWVLKTDVWASHFAYQRCVLTFLPYLHCLLTSTFRTQSVTEEGVSKWTPTKTGLISVAEITLWALGIKKCNVSQYQLILSLNSDSNNPRSPPQWNRLWTIEFCCIDPDLRWFVIVYKLHCFHFRNKGTYWYVCILICLSAWAEAGREYVEAKWTTDRPNVRPTHVEVFIADSLFSPLQFE